MKEQTTIIVAILFVLVFSIYLVFYSGESIAPPEPEMVTEVLDIPVGDDTETELSGEEFDALNDAEMQTAPETPDFLDSFDEGALEEEFDDVQSGIDLLNNPLQ